MRRVLVAVVLALLVVVGAESWWLATAGEEPSPERPVVVGAQTARASADEAARQASAVLSYGFEDFDEQLDDAASRMTPDFAAEFADRVAADRTRFEEGRITQEARIVDVAVVSADEDHVVALVFLDYYVARAGAGTSVQPRRVVVTAVRDDGRWLVDGMSLV